MKKLLIVLFAIPTFLLAAKPAPKEINWISFEKAIELNKTNPKPILIDIYTDWCHWCKVMDEKTYSNDVIINYINENYYAVKFNAEQKEDIHYKDKTFKFIKGGTRGYHELALTLLEGKLGFPATVFLNSKEELVHAVPGYLKPKEMEKLINFVHQKKYISSDWDTFNKEFQSKL